MNESKIELTERLRREGRWSEASKFKDEAVKKLRAQGLKRTQACQQAWQEMAEAYPPLPPAESARDPGAEDDAVDEVTKMVCDGALVEVKHWQEKHGIALGDDARDALAGEVVAYYWAMGLLGEIPGVAVAGDPAGPRSLPDPSPPSECAV